MSWKSGYTSGQKASWVPCRTFWLKRPCRPLLHKRNRNATRWRTSFCSFRCNVTLTRHYRKWKYRCYLINGSLLDGWHECKSLILLLTDYSPDRSFQVSCICHNRMWTVSFHVDALVDTCLSTCTDISIQGTFSSLKPLRQRLYSVSYTNVSDNSQISAIGRVNQYTFLRFFCIIPCELIFLLELFPLAVV
ncbi:hypothetical protein CEXT_131741 [Caerostris extrusa]|uniref:Uncharacterized protein n=1 Tax=Caerostris extrusa TaxID=172846 RepID=A0AAV4QSI5_CAEEX|nr:hypothetical protein CEXT_131741 [Caerostris extrusa]